MCLNLCAFFCFKILSFNVRIIRYPNTWAHHYQIWTAYHTQPKKTCLPSNALPFQNTKKCNVPRVIFFFYSYPEWPNNKIKWCHFHTTQCLLSFHSTPKLSLIKNGMLCFLTGLRFIKHWVTKHWKQCVKQQNHQS